MKHRIIQLFALCSLAGLVGSKEESTTTAAPESPAPERRYSIGTDQAITQRMKEQENRIVERLGMSSSLDANDTTDPVTGTDVIQELYASGYIIPATLEEVEEAVRAAARTQDTEDDMAAQILKHRGSYRFFLAE